MTVTRRELLALIAGAPLAARACRSERSLPGSIRGASMAVGHRLRDATPERASGAPAVVDTVIVGAGPSGLSAAWRLHRLGLTNFVVLDLEPSPGGTSTYGTDGVVPHPWGAHYVPLPTADNRALTLLLDEMGVLEAREPAPRAIETAFVREPEERVFVDGAWHEGLFPSAIAGAEDRAELQRFEAEVAKWVRFRDARGRRAFALPLRRCSDAAEVTALDRISAARFLDDLGIRRPIVRWWVEYACRDDYGCTLADTSAWAMLFYFASRVAEAGAESAPFLTFPEGNGRLVRHLAGVAGARLKLGTLVTDVVPAAEHVDVAAVDVASGRLSVWRARHVVLAVPKMIARRVLRPFRERPPEHLSKFTYGAWMVANLHLKERPRSPGFGPAWDNVIYDSPSLGYVVATHQRLSDYGPTVWTYYLPLVSEPNQARRALADADHQSLARAVMADLAPAHERLDDVVERIDVWRWGHAMVRPVPGLIWGGALQKAKQPLGRVHFACSDLSGVGLFEEAQDHGVRAAEEVARAQGRDFSSLSG